MSEINKPYIGWIDFSEEDQKRAREFLRKANSDDTLDELGFGIIRNAFSDMFFPATNTIMTHVRYLIFIPSIMLFLERKKVPSREMGARCRAMENRLREKFPEIEKGVIGREAEETLKRYPSNIYWSALKALGIYRYSHTQQYYYDHMDEFYRSNHPVKDDDKSPHLLGEPNFNWDNDFVYYDEAPFINKDGEFNAKITFKLLKEEIEYLKKRYDDIARRKGMSIISFALNIKDFHDFLYPWDVKTGDAILDEKIDHARYFSMMIKGVRLQYFQMLIEALAKINRTNECGSLLEPFKLWWEGSRKDLLMWDLAKFYKIVGDSGALRRGDTGFITDWMDSLKKSHNSEKCFTDTGMRELIRSREKGKRPTKARLAHEKYLKQWNPPEFNDKSYTEKQMIPYSLDYRSDIGGTFIEELRGGLAGNV